MTFTTFQPNCSLPDAPVDYLDSPQIRSTLNIIWSSISTIIACTYTSVHLNIIADDTVTSGESRSWADTQRTLRNVAVELSVAAMTAIAPEYMLLVAANDLREARSLRQSLNSTNIYSGGKRHPNWTLTLARYAVMGGFRLCLPTSSAADGDEKRPKYSEVTLNKRAMLLGIEGQIISRQPPISEVEVGDLSKANLFAKSLAIGQIIWFGVNIVTRLARKLPVSQLEVGTVAFIVVSVPTWAYYFTKPKGVQCGTRIYPRIPLNTLEYAWDYDLDTQTSTGRASASGGVELTELASESIRERRMAFQEELEELKYHQKRRIKVFENELSTQLNLFPPGFGTQRNKMEEPGAHLFISALVAIPFGAIHVAAWNASFPMDGDRWMWRAASLVTMSPALIYIALAMVRLRSICDVPRIESYTYRAGNGAGIITVTIYAMARIIIIIEMIRCLTQLPPEMFVATWTNNIPHIG